MGRVACWPPAMSKTGWLSLQPAGSPVAPFSVRSRRRLPQAPASLSQSTPWAALAGHLGLVFGLVFDIGPEGILLRVLHLNTVRSRLAALRESLAVHARHGDKQGITNHSLDSNAHLKLNRKALSSPWLLRRRRTR